MEIPVVEVPLIGRAGTIALVALVHIMFANLALGGPMIAVFSEWLGVRTGNQTYERFAYALARVNVVAFSVGAVLGVGLVATLTGLWPIGWTTILNMYFWPLALEVVFFFLEGALLYYYVYSWHRHGPGKKGRHIAWGASAVVAGLGTMLIINGVAAAMLTPQPNALALGGGGPEAIVTKFGPLFLDNPTWLPLSLHRLVGAISFTGFLVATVAALAYWRARSRERRSYFGWMTGYAMRFGLLPLVAMPAIGFFYVNEVRGPSPMAFVAMMVGDLRWAFNVQIVLLAALFLAGNWYLVRSLRGKGADGSGWSVVRHWTLIGGVTAVAIAVFIAWYGSSQGFRTPLENWGIVVLMIALYGGAFALLQREERQAAAFDEQADWARVAAALLPLVVVCTVVAALPYNQLGLGGFFLGQMRPWKFAALIGLTTLTIPIVAMYLKAPAPSLREKEAFASPAIPLFCGVTALAIMFVMGYVREAARAPYLIYNQLAVADDVFERAGSVTTVPMPPALAVPLMLFGMLAFAALGLMVLHTAHGTAVEEETVEDLPTGSAQTDY